MRTERQLTLPSPARRPKNRARAKNVATEKWVYSLAEGDSEMRDLLGGKGANLAEMTRLGLPVPPGFTLTTRACNAFLSNGGNFPDGMWRQVQNALNRLERQTGRRLGDAGAPLLVSCRSGARYSMPGMMDTVLNIGLNDEVVQGLLTTSDPRFVFDAYRRLLQMFGSVVLDVDAGCFTSVLAELRQRRGVTFDTELGAEDLEAACKAFRRILREKSAGFPEDPFTQLKLATEAVFRSWNGKRAYDYRRAAGIPHDLGTAVNVVTMVFGNLGPTSGTGVLTTRNVSTGLAEMEGDYLSNAQGEDVVAGVRTTQRIAALGEQMPHLYGQLQRHCKRLERHFKDVQDVEFTIEEGKLWILQTRAAKRTAQAAIRIAVDLVEERRISKAEAVRRITPEHVDYFLHPQFDPADRKAAQARGDRLAQGLNVSPGAASGHLAFDADTAERWALKDKKPVIMVRQETRPDDVHGMLAANGVLTSRGGRTSHAALVARQFGKPAVVGASTLDVDLQRRCFTVDGRTFREGDVVSLDGSTGEVFAGALKTVVPDFADPYLLKLLGWADGLRHLEVWANADYPRDAERARTYGAQGIGLCRTEHMFFEPQRLPLVQGSILAKTDAERQKFLDKLLPLQREDFRGLFRAMNHLPVTIRLIDPPLHEFLPNHDELLREVTELKTRLTLTKEATERAALEEQLAQRQVMLQAVEDLREDNPMLGLRGVRLGLHLPAFVKMQIRAIFEAALDCAAEGIEVQPQVMVPLVAHRKELQLEKQLLEAEAAAVMLERGARIPYKVGTMIEVPRAALTADQIAQYAAFFSFGTNDLTQTTYGISRDDAETGFLSEYLQRGILKENPFATIDRSGVGALMKIAVDGGRKVNPRLHVGICGEHGGDPKTIAFCHQIGLDYVSCSPFRVPVARLAAAHAALESAAKK
jgi:pyruvate,orthophosphate dikinase